MRDQKQKIKYIAYIRKSSDREDAQTLSLGSQKRELQKIAQNKNLKIVKFIEESASAYKIGRKGFAEMIEYIESGKADGILVYHLTRIARNSFDGGRVIYLMDEGFIKEIRTPEKGYYGEISDDKFMMQIHFAMAKKSSDDTSQFVKRDIQSKILKGEYPLSVPIGYLNLDKYQRITGIRFDNDKQRKLEELASREKRQLKRVEPDPELAPIIVKMFELYSTNQYSLDELRKETYEMGLRGLRSGSMLTKSTLRRILTNPIYYGAMQINNKLYKPEDFPSETKHDPIISKKLFDNVQDILNNKQKPRKQVHNHKYTGIIRCGECGGMITAEVQKGTTYYRCTKKKGFNVKCSQPYIREDELEKQIQKGIKDYVIPEKFVKWALQELNKSNESEQKKQKAILSQQRKQLSQIENELSRLLKLKISLNNSNNELLSDEEYLKQKKELQEEQEALSEKISDSEQNFNNWLEHCENFFDFATKCEEKWIIGDPMERRMIFSIIFGSNATLKDRKLRIIAKKPFFRTEILEDSYKWRGRPGSNRRPSA